MARMPVPLHTALRYAQKDLVEFLPALAPAKDNDGETPLHDAASGGESEVAELLLARGADINAENSSRP